MFLQPYKRNLRRWGAYPQMLIIPFSSDQTIIRWNQVVYDGKWLNAISWLNSIIDKLIE